MSDFDVIHEGSDFAVVPLKTDFEVRREKAREVLLHWAFLQSIPAEDEGKKEERAQHKNKIFPLLNDPLQVGIGPLLENGAKQEDFIKVVRAMYGDDATDFAFRASESWAN